MQGCSRDVGGRDRDQDREVRPRDPRRDRDVLYSVRDETRPRPPMSRDETRRDLGYVSRCLETETLETEIYTTTKAYVTTKTLFAETNR